MKSAAELGAVVGDKEFRLAVLFCCALHESEHRGRPRRPAIDSQGQQFAGEAVQDRRYVECEPEHPDARKVHVPDMIRPLWQQQMVRRDLGRLFQRGFSFRRCLWFRRFGLAQNPLDA